MTRRRTGIDSTAAVERDQAVRAVRDAYRAKVGHVCPMYVTARSGPPHYEGPADPALQGGIGCPICYPPDGRYRPPTATSPDERITP